MLIYYSDKYIRNPLWEMFVPELENTLRGENWEQITKLDDKDKRNRVVKYGFQ